MRTATINNGIYSQVSVMLHSVYISLCLIYVDLCSTVAGCIGWFMSWCVCLCDMAWCVGWPVQHWSRVYWLVRVLLCLYDMAWFRCVDLCRTVAEWVNPGQYSLVVVTSSEGRSLPYGKLEDILSRETAALNCHTNDDKYVDLGNVCLGKKCRYLFLSIHWHKL